MKKYLEARWFSAKELSTAYSIGTREGWELPNEVQQAVEGCGMQSYGTLWLLYSSNPTTHRIVKMAKKIADAEWREAAMHLHSCMPDLEGDIPF